MKNNIPLRPLSDNEKLALEYVRQHPGCQAEEAINFMVPFSNADEIRMEVSLAFGYLMANGYINRNPRTSALTVSDTPPQ